MATSRAYLAYLALGSNLGDRIANLVAAREAIGASIGCTLKQSSSLYESAAWGSSERQPDYLNAVIAIDTTLAPTALWRCTSDIEFAHGRVRSSVPNAARTLDIDLLLFAELIIDTDELVLPHPRMHLRKFVLCPLLEIAPDVSIPGRGAARALTSQLVDSDPRKLSHNPAWN